MKIFMIYLFTKKRGIKMANRIKKVLIYVILSVLVFSNMPSNVYSASQETTSKSNIIAPQAEEFSWYYRDILGGKQKRLWTLP